MVDYMLNVAVGISAGIAALTSALPVLQRYTLPLCLTVLALVTLVNLRAPRNRGSRWRCRPICSSPDWGRCCCSACGSW